MMPPKSVFFLVAFCMIATGAHVQAQNTPLTAKALQKYRGYLQPIDGYAGHEERLELEFKKIYEWPAAKVVLAPLVRIDAPNSVAGARRDYALLADVQEAYVATEVSAVDLSAGYQQISWGAADIANPTDLWNPRDYTDALAPRKMSHLTLQTLIHPDGLANIDFQLLYSPMFRNPRLPILLSDGTRDFKASDSRWLLPLPTNVIFGNNNLALNYEVQKPTYARSGEYGLRVRIPKVFDWDFSLYAFDGMEKLPRFSYEERGNASNPALPITVSLKPSFHRQTMAGLDASGFLGESEVGIRLESAYVWRDNSMANTPALIRNDYIESVMSVDRSFSAQEFSYIDYLNLSYVQHDETTKRTRSQNTTYLPAVELSQPWDRTLALMAKEEVFERWTLKSIYVYELTNSSYYFTPSIVTDWTDSLNTELGLDLFGGPSNSFFGQYKDNQRVVFNASYLF